METTRQDAWSQEEDKLLADLVLTYISEGKTQLEAFKATAHSLSRTPAACGFRWNATIRKKYLMEIETAKNNRKEHVTKQIRKVEQTEDVAIDSVITLLEKVKATVQSKHGEEEMKDTIANLRDENNRLLSKINSYEEAWEEMGNIWKWIHNENERNEQ